MLEGVGHWCNDASGDDVQDASQVDFVGMMPSQLQLRVKTSGLPSAIYECVCPKIDSH